MSRNPSLFDIGTNSARGWSSGVQFGRNKVTSITYEPVSVGAIYRTPQVADAVQLRVAAGNINDSPGGSGAHSVYIQGMDVNGDWITETIATNGAVVGVASTQSFIRIFQAFIAASGTYATQSLGSHAGDVVIEDDSGNTWATIAIDNFPRGQSQIAALTVPRGYQLWIIGITITIESNKEVSVALFQRRNVLDTAAPYSAMRVIEEHTGLTGELLFKYDAPYGPYPPLTDIGLMGRTIAQTADISVQFSYLLERIA